MAQSLGARVRQLRTARGMTQPALARALSCSINALSQLETGVILDPRASRVVRLAEVFGVTTDYLLGHEMAAVSTSPSGPAGA